MTTPIRIKRRASTGSAGAPSQLYNGELAFSEPDKILYYGYGIGTGLSAAAIIGIGGEGAYVTLATTQTISGTKTFSNPISATLTNALSIGAGLSQNGTTYDGSSAKSISLPNVGSPGTYGSSTAIPVITTDAYGRVSSVSTSSISTTINLAGNSGTGSVSTGGTLYIAGGTGITTAATGSGITVSIDSTVVTLSGTQTLTNKTINSASNTIQLNGNQIIGYTGSGSSVVLSNSPTLTSPTLGAATATSITGSSGNLTITAASGNNNVSLVPTGTGVVDVSSTRITNVADPKLPLDACNKQYADAIASSLNIHSEVQAATYSSVSYTYVGGGTSQTITTIASNVITFSANHGLAINSQVRSNNTANGLTTGTTYYVLTLPALNQVTVSTTPGGNTTTLTDGSGLNISTTTNQGVGAQLTGTGQTVDGYNVVLGDRILVKDHTTSAYNGVYTVTTVGTGSNGVWTRAVDFDNSPTGEISAGDYCFVGLGTTNGKTGFVQTTSGPIIVGTSSITFTQFTAANTYVAGTGISISGNNISISTSYSGQSSITTVGTINSGTWNGNTIGVPYGGTGLATTPTNGQLLIGNGTNYTLNTLGVGTGITVANSAGGISISNTGVTALATSGNGISVNASTGSVTISSGATSANTVSTIVYRDTSGNFSAGAISASSLTLSSALTVPNGGTGVGTFTSKGILYGNGTGAISVTAAAGTGDSNTSNQILTVDGNNFPIWATAIDGGTY